MKADRAPRHVQAFCGILALSRAAQPVDLVQLFCQFISDTHKVVVDLVLSHPVDDLVVAVQAPHIPVIGLAPEALTEFTINAPGAPMPGEQLNLFLPALKVNFCRLRSGQSTGPVSHR